MKNLQKTKRQNKKSRQRRVRAKIFGTAQKPRLCVFRSNSHIYAQLIDDAAGRTLLSAHDFELAVKDKKTDRAKQVGRLIAEKAKKRNITEVIFDRAGYTYHGRVSALAQGARDGGLTF